VLYFFVHHQVHQIILCFETKNIMSLSDTKLRNIPKKYDGKPELADRDGLSVRVSPKGIITFNYRFRWLGKQQRIKIGRYPGISLADARKRVEKFKQILLEGLDPRTVQAEQYEKRLLVGIYSDFLKIKRNELKQTTMALYDSTFNKYVKNFGSIDVERFSYQNWIEYFDEVRHVSSASNAGMILKRFKAVIRWAKSRGAIKTSEILTIPVSAVGVTMKKRKRKLEWDEVVGLWRKVEQSQSTPKCKICIQLLILTGARNAEIREARRNEFNLEKCLWILPEERSKNKNQIRRPLSTGSILLIEKLDLIYGKDREFLIEGDKEGRPLTAHAVNRFVQRMNEHLNFQHFVPHDFRRTISTRLSEEKVELHVTEKMLGHSLGGILEVYNKHDWLEEQEVAYELYWKKIETFLINSSKP
jgi:integrase